jgi:LPXTG-motif cell wall-anchored protein
MLRRLLRACALAALAFAAVPLAAPAQGDPVAVFRQVIDARNRADLAGVMALFAPDAVRQDGSCQPPCAGEAAIRRSFEENIAEHFQATVLTAQATGTTVTARAELRSDRFRALGAGRVLSNFTVEVRDGKIARWTSTLDGSDAQTAAYQAALRAQAGPPGSTPAQLPRTGEATAPTAAPWLILGSLLLVVGLGVLRRRRAMWPSH